MEIVYLKFKIVFTSSKTVDHNELGGFNCYIEYLLGGNLKYILWMVGS